MIIFTQFSDGDRFTVIWDPDLVPKKVAEVCCEVIPL